jgi:hypothetical protein
VVRRFAQPLGIHLPEWEGRIIETEKGVVRLLSVKERAKQLFGEESVSVAMLLQAGCQTNALRALLKAEQDRGPDFLRLANALSALYPKDSEEKRLLDAMLLAMPRT